MKGFKMFRILIKVVFWLKDLYCDSFGHTWVNPDRYPRWCSRCGISQFADGTENTYYSMLHRSSMIVRLQSIRRPICLFLRHDWYGDPLVSERCRRCGKFVRHDDEGED